MNPRTSTHGHGTKINHEVTNLAEKVVLVSVPVGTSVFVWVRVDDSNTLETSRGFDGRDIDSITNELSVVILDNWLRDNIGTGREVDKSRNSGGRIATQTTATTISDGFVDSGGVIG